MIIVNNSKKNIKNNLFYSQNLNTSNKLRRIYEIVPTKSFYLCLQFLHMNGGIEHGSCCTYLQ